MEDEGIDLSDCTFGLKGKRAVKLMTESSLDQTKHQCLQLENALHHQSFSLDHFLPVYVQ